MRNVKAEHDKYVMYHKEHQDVIPIMGIIVIFGYLAEGYPNTNVTYQNQRHSQD